MRHRPLVEVAERLALKGQIPMGEQNYFHLHCSRLSKTIELFRLDALSKQRLLEIGPFFGFTPFMLHDQGNEVSVLEGTDPVMAPLLKLYQEFGIACTQLNLLRTFALSGEEGHLPYEDASVDGILCFETMEHFNFNPVVFVRELFRILKPGGRAYITVPNQGKLDNRIKLLLGKTVRTPIKEYYQFADYNCGEFLGFHWREYLLPEMAELFAGAKFQVELATHFNSFQDHDHHSFGRRLKRALGAGAVALVPSFAANCAVIARKPSLHR